MSSKGSSPSSKSGKGSVMSSKVASRVSREPGRMGSIMRRFPSLRNRTSLLGRVKSLGMVSP